MPNPLSPLEVLEKLIAFPTVSRDSNLPLIDWVYEYLTAQGIQAWRHYDAAAPKAALFAHAGPLQEGALVLSAHTDVVPTDGQAWESNPFILTRRGDRYFGRGTCDMKGFGALAIWAMVEAHRRGVARPLQLALSYDEEIGCLGAPGMVAAMQKQLPRGSAVLVGEPSLMQVVSGHKGCSGYDVRLHGYEVHSALLHKGVNAIMAGAKLVDWANQVNTANQAKPPSPLAAVFDPPWTSAHVGTIRGGTAFNITARECCLDFAFRTVPDETLDQWEEALMARVRTIEAEMQAVVAQTRIDVVPRFRMPGLVPEERGAAEAMARKLTGDNGTHVVSYGTDGGVFQKAGYSAVICGPGSIEQAHQPNEFITVAQFEAGHQFIQQLLKTLQA